MPGALAVSLTAEDEALVDRLVTTGHPSTPGFNDPGHPVEGRVPRSAGSPSGQILVPFARPVRAARALIAAEKAKSLPPEPDA